MPKWSPIGLMVKANRDIKGTAGLSVGWNYGRGEPSSLLARNNAIVVASLLIAGGAEEIAVFPDTDGGIMLTGYREDTSADVLCVAGGGFEVTFETGDVESPIVRAPDYSQLEHVMRGNGWQERNTSASFLQNIMMFGSGDIIDSPSRTQRAAASPSLIWDAPSTRLAMYVDTSYNIILGGLPAPRQRSGVSTQASYLPAAPSFSPLQRAATTATTILSGSQTISAALC